MVRSSRHPGLILPSDTALPHPIETNAPLSRGLEVLAVPGLSSKNLVNQDGVIDYNTPTESFFQSWGKARKFNGSNQYQSIPTRSFASTDSFSVACVSRLNTIGIGHGIVSSAGTTSWFVQTGGDVKPLQFGPAVHGVFNSSSSGIAAQTGRIYSMLGVYEYPNQWRFYIDGILVGYDMDYSHSGVSAWSGLDIGRRGDGSYSHSEIAYTALWRRVVSPAEVWQQFAPQTRWSMIRTRTKRQYPLPSTPSETTLYQRRSPGICRLGSRSATC